jgi:hypothetical protein
MNLRVEISFWLSVPIVVCLLRFNKMNKHYSRELLFEFHACLFSIILCFFMLNVIN